MIDKSYFVYIQLDSSSVSVCIHAAFPHRNQILEPPNAYFTALPNLPSSFFFVMRLSLYFIAARGLTFILANSLSQFSNVDGSKIGIRDKIRTRVSTDAVPGTGFDKPLSKDEPYSIASTNQDIPISQPGAFDLAETPSTSNTRLAADQSGEFGVCCTKDAYNDDSALTCQRGKSWVSIIPIISHSCFG